MRLTMNIPINEMGMLELAHNCCFAKDRKAMYRDYETIIDAREFARNLIKCHGLVNNEDQIFHNDDAFDEFITVCLAADPRDKIGLIALFYRGLWAQADLHERLKIYEDAEEQGKISWLPVAVGDIVYANFSVQGDYLRKCKKPYACKVVFIGLNEENPFVNVKYENGRMWQFHFDEFGKTVFKIKSEAEEALKRAEDSNGVLS